MRTVTYKMLINGARHQMGHHIKWFPLISFNLLFCKNP
jgi:hypothetical protein